MAIYQARPHPTDENSRHDNRYLTEEEITAITDTLAIRGDTELTLEEAIDGFNTGIEGRARITVDTDAPADPNSGDIWIDSDADYVAYTWDAATEEWVEIVSGVDESQILRSPMHPDYGAVGDGVADDTAALQAWIDTELGSGSVTRQDANGKVLDGLGRSYLITSAITVNDVWFFTLQNLHLVVDDDLTDALFLGGVSYSTFQNILITASGGWAGSTLTYGIRLESNQGVTTPAASSSSNMFVNCRTVDVTLKHGFAIGPTSGAFQASETRWIGCQTTAQFDLADYDAADPDFALNGFLFGSGTPGNILNHELHGCFANGFKHGCNVDVTNVTWFGGGVDNCGDAFRHGGSHNLSIYGMRVESCRRFLITSTGTNFDGHTTVHGLTFDCNELHADSRWLMHATIGQLKLYDVRINPSGGLGGSAKFYMSNGTANMFEVHGLRNPTPIAECYESTGGAPKGIISGYVEVDDDGVLVSTTGGPVLVGPTSRIEALVGTNPPDVSLYRDNTFGAWYTAGSFVSGMGLQVANTSSEHDYMLILGKSTDTVPRFTVAGTGVLEWGSGSGARDLDLRREEANLLQLATGDSFRLVDGYLEMGERSDPSAPGSNMGRLYVKDNGSGKSQLAVRFPSGAVQVIATEP